MKDISDNSSILPSSAAILPQPYSKDDAERGLQQWQDAAGQQQDKALGNWMHASTADANPLRPLLAAVFGNSPYLSRLLLLYPALLRDMARIGADVMLTRLADDLEPIRIENDQAELMRQLRINKGKLALLTALADISGAWTLTQVTAALSDFAERSLSIAIDALLRVNHKRGEIEISESKNSGIIVLGMGKLGGRELNYSSDIDLVIFFEPEKLGYKGRQNEQHFMNKLAHDLVSIMQERTRDGYVFRTDLRLRPDPASMPPAIATIAAHYYYESVGQNWERAAMIKARVVAGDIAAGERFLAGIAPFMWRRSLDFASINDIHSIKRQMDSVGNKTIQLKGHNIKLGQGGIREIEFYTQIHQLIWGGREPALRLRGTCETLHKLVEFGQVDSNKEKILREAYEFLRKLEHRLQMIADEQTHELPETDAGMTHVAYFMGYENVGAFEKDALKYLNEVHTIYASSFRSADKLGDEGNLVFTGVSHDPETLETLRRMGYSQAETVSEIVMGWHHGKSRATRSKRARELLTELMPLLLKRLSETAQPDAAFLKFNDFLSQLPAGVQMFSLFNINPHLLGLIADIMGSAPMLALTLSKSPELLDAVLYEDFYGPLPSANHLSQQLDDILANLHDFEETLEGLRRFRNEKQFQAGVQLLKAMITARQAGIFLTGLAEIIIQKTLAAVSAEFARSYGHIKNSLFAIIGLGKLGSRELTFGSDIDLVFVYDAEDADALSDGAKKFSASVYFNRLAQRFLSVLSAMGRNGRLYEVDTRLRPSGDQGLLAVSIDTLAHYFDESAWTFEIMAFAKARIISGEALKEPLETLIRKQFTKPRDMEKLRADVIDMRERIEKEYGGKNPWDIKYVRGGLIDIDFIAQYLLLRHAPNTPSVRGGSAAEIFDWLKRSDRLKAADADALIEFDRFLGQMFNMLRLCCDRSFDEATALPGLKKLLVASAKEKDFTGLKKRLIGVEAAVYEHYNRLLQS